MKSFGLTDKGAVRKENQDSFIIEECFGGCTVAALCDGMGGVNAGGLAGEIAVRAFVSYVQERLGDKGGKRTDIPKLLTDACKNANGVVYEYSLFDEAYSGMGTTIVGGVIKNGGKGYIINVGDSRAYLLSPKKGTLTRITKDHSLVQLLVDTGAITPEQAKTHPRKNLITRALGTSPAVEADFFGIELARGDILLLCSDGLTNTLEEEEILAAAKESGEPETLCRTLMDRALGRGANDNVTVAAVTR